MSRKNVSSDEPSQSGGSDALGSINHAPPAGDSTAVPHLEPTPEGTPEPMQHSASTERRQPAFEQQRQDTGGSGEPSSIGSRRGAAGRGVRYADAALPPLDIPAPALDPEDANVPSDEDTGAGGNSPRYLSARDRRRSSTYLMSAGQTIMHFGEDDDDDEDPPATQTEAGPGSNNNSAAGSPGEADAATAGLTTPPGGSAAFDGGQPQSREDLGRNASAERIPLMVPTAEDGSKQGGYGADGAAGQISDPNLDRAGGGSNAPPPPPRRTVTHRMKHAAFAQLTVRDGERFLVLEQQGTSVPILRDFDSAKSLFGHLTAQQPDFRALGGGEDSDDDDGDASVSSEPDARTLEKELNRSFANNNELRGGGNSGMQRSTSSAGAMPRPPTPDYHGRSPPKSAKSASSSSSSSSSSTMSGLVPPRTMWVDVQTQDTKVIQDLLAFFPRLDRDTIDDVEEHDAVDTAHWFAHQRYLFANIECYVVDTDQSSFRFRPEAIGSFEGLLMSSGRTTIVSLIAFSDVTITIHAEPFMGHRGALQALYGTVARRRKGFGPAASPHGAPRGPGALPGTAGGGGRGNAHSSHRPPHRSHGGATAVDAFGKKKRLTIGGIVAHVVENIVIAGLPDPTACLGEVDRIDEMVLLVTNDSHDLLRRIARVRRILSAHRSSLFRKERFLKQFTSPALRATFISGFTSEQYRHTLGEVYHVAERLEAARDVLTQANSNFVSHISLQVAQISNHMNVKMKALSQVATVCLPLNIITGLFGMNVTVPFNSTAFPDTLLPFFSIVGSMIILLIMGIPFIYRSMREKKAEAVGALEA